MQDGFFRGRSPLGLRGLKWLQPCVNSDCPSRSPLGLRGLKFRPPAHGFLQKGCRSPLGLRGLKCCIEGWLPAIYQSQPTRAAWIEILRTILNSFHGSRSQPTRAAWIEILPGRTKDFCQRSQPTRAAWIEIISDGGVGAGFVVAAHSGCVD